MADQTTTPQRAGTFELFAINAYWPALSFMWNSLHVIILPAVLLAFVEDARKNTVLGLLTFVGLVIALLIQPISGALSDAWHSRLGRRRPLMVLGTLGDLIFLYIMATAGAGAASRLTGPGIDALNAMTPGANLGYSALFAGGAVLALISLLALRRVPDRKRLAAPVPASEPGV